MENTDKFSLEIHNLEKEKCIRDLKASMELYLLDPSTGEKLTPVHLDDLSRMTYEAMRKAVDLLSVS